ncbi:MAG: DUF72 domain-containing protein [Gemmatimonadetes bacterium]|nr:DUF72 domain-containing protein [Gemmatimonadota bacterium]
MADRVGTSGWSYDEWTGPFYPEGTPASARLAYYAQRLGAVEVNNTFYRMPKRDVLAGWAEQVPEGFRFVIKASRRISHQGKLGPDAREALEFLVRNVSEMGPTFGALLVQTPPWLKADLDTLRTFLDWIPEGIRVAFEFRSRSWFEDRVVDTLAERGHALAAADTGNPDKDPPLAAGGGWCYARLRREDYDEAALREWARRLAALPVEDRYVFFKHEDEAAGPRIAARFTELLAEGVG